VYWLSFGGFEVRPPHRGSRGVVAMTEVVLERVGKVFPGDVRRIGPLR
jgi:hypothetical protein